MGGRPLPVVHTGLDDAAIADCFRTEVDNELPSGEVVLDFLPDEAGACKRNGLFVKVKLCFVTYGFFGIDVLPVCTCMYIYEKATFLNHDENWKKSECPCSCISTFFLVKVTQTYRVSECICFENKRVRLVLIEPKKNKEPWGNVPKHCITVFVDWGSINPS